MLIKKIVFQIFDSILSFGLALTTLYNVEEEILGKEVK